MVVKKDESPRLSWFRRIDRRVADAQDLPARQGLQLINGAGGIERDDTEIHTALAVELLGHGHAELEPDLLNLEFRRLTFSFDHSLAQLLAQMSNQLRQRDRVSRWHGFFLSQIRNLEPAIGRRRVSGRRSSA